MKIGTFLLSYILKVRVILLEKEIYWFKILLIKGIRGESDVYVKQHIIIYIQQPYIHTMLITD